MMASDPRRSQGRVLVAGVANGIALVLKDDLSFAMAFDVSSGRITDVHSEGQGTSVTGRVLVMDSGRGSSSASTALAEAIRLGTAPAAIVLGEVDEILAVGAMVARKLYGRTCPIVLLETAARERIATGDLVSITTDGMVTLV
jgi:predicted aconitase with swiveling domain